MKRLTWIRALATSMITLGVAGVFAFDLHADDTGASVAANAVQISDGKESVIFSFDEKPEVSFGEAEIVISSSQRTVVFPMSANLVFTFVDNSGVGELDVESVSFQISGNEILAIGLKSNEQVLFFNMKGELLLASAADSDGKFRLQTDFLPKQPVIVRTDKISYKFLIK